MMHGITLFVGLCCIHSWAAHELLIKFRDNGPPAGFTDRYNGTLTPVSRSARIYKWTSDVSARPFELADDGTVEFSQPNYPIRLLANPSIVSNQEPLHREFGELELSDGPAYPDNPTIKLPEQTNVGEDQLLSQSWGLFQIAASTAWNNTQQGKNIIVAVTDTGVDYNHEDLIHNMWRNSREIVGDGIDNDQNGYIDDVVGWDFYSNDKFPYDLSMSLSDILFKGGNPGHGTHVAGVIGSGLRNVKGTAGVAPQVSIMALRFISELGQGDTAGAIGAIDYAVQNGASIINASWGSEGEEEGNDLLREAIERAETRGVIFVAAAGNGRMNPQTMQSSGYDNDTDSKPMFPASYPYSNIVAVAATGNADQLAPFSNYGKKSVDIGAPGVKILSTVPESRYQDTLIDIGQIKVTWDGTSMASPFVSGALAAIWSSNRALSSSEVIEMLLTSAKPVGPLTSKVATDGRLDLGTL